MSTQATEPVALELSGCDGTNPLGFLAAVGTLVTLHGAGERGARLSWRRRSTWLPVLEGVSTTDPEAISEKIARGLKGREVSAEAEEQRKQSVKLFDTAKSKLAKKEQEIKKRGLKGSDRNAAIEAELEPLQQELHRARRIWLDSLAAAVPRPELALGKRIDCTPEEYRQLADMLLADSVAQDRTAIDLMAAFGSDAVVDGKSASVEPTPFQFTTGTGHQFFLRTVRQLMAEANPERIRRTLFEPWTYPDEKLSLRWDPNEDRRYALMDRDPTASGNKPRTMWMANLLGYRALVLFPCAPRRGRLRVVSWRTPPDDERAFTWPLWELPASPDTIRSLFTLPELASLRPAHTSLRARGVAAVFRARRIRVGTGANFKFNFTPARAV